MGGCRQPVPFLTKRDVQFCLDQNQITVPFTICNWGGTPTRLTWSLAPLDTSTPGCTIDGPTYISPASGKTLQGS